LILTYTVDFDRVHFPLPLLFEETPNPTSQQRTILRLRTEVERYREMLANRGVRVGEGQESGEGEETSNHNKKEEGGGNQDENGGDSFISSLRRENTELKHRVRRMEGRLREVDESRIGREMSKLRKENQSQLRTIERLGEEADQMKTERRVDRGTMENDKSVKRKLKETQRGMKHMESDHQREMVYFCIDSFGLNYMSFKK